MKRIFPFIVFLLCSVTVFPARTVITGTVEGQNSGTVRLMTYEDMVSYRKITLASSAIGPNGNYEMSVDIAETIYAFMDFNFQQGEVFLSPGGKITINLFPQKDAGQKAYYDRQALNMEIKDLQGINEQVGRINAIYNEFLLENAASMNSPGRKEKVEKAISKMKAVAAENDVKYLQNYLKYKAGSLQMFFRTTSKENLAGNYLVGKEVLYLNVEYMDFFHLFFEKYLLTNNPYLPYSKTSALVNGTYSRKEILKDFSRDPVLADPRMAELVLLAGLKDMAVTPGFEQKRIFFLLDEIAATSEFSEHKVIAANIKSRVLWMKPGSLPPALKLKDVNGTERELSDYHGRYIYLSFISLYSPSSLSEMNILADLYPDYRDRINFLTVIVDELRPGWRQITSDYRMTWDLLQASGELDLLENYGATAPPIFMVIDPQGNIYRYPAPSPSEELRNFLDELN